LWASGREYGEQSTPEAIVDPRNCRPAPGADLEAINICALR
jgi:hypothetical protein